MWEVRGWKLWWGKSGCEGGLKGGIRGQVDVVDRGWYFEGGRGLDESSGGKSLKLRPRVFEATVVVRVESMLSAEWRDIFCTRDIGVGFVSCIVRIHVWGTEAPVL